MGEGGGDILIRNFQYGLTTISRKEKQEIRYIRISEVTDYGTLKNDDLHFIYLEPEEYEKYKLEKGEILIARSRSVGRIYLHKILSTKTVFGSYLIRFKLDKIKLLTEIFFYYGLTPFHKNFINEILKIVAQSNINAKEYLNLLIPLPALEEQKLIVAYLDKIEEKVQTLQKLQEETEKEIEMLKEAILYKAFRGKL